MKRIFIVGGALAGFKAAQQLVKQSQDIQLTFFPVDGIFPYDSDRLADVIEGEVKAEELGKEAQEWFTQNNIEVVTDQEITRINIKRKRLFTAEKKQFEFDVLLLTELPQQRFGDIKGTKKSGVYGANRLQDIEEIARQLVLHETISIMGGRLNTVKLACAIANQKREVELVSSGQNDFWSLFSEEALNVFQEALSEKGLRIIRDNAIEEVLGDGDARAIRLSSGKVLASDMIILEDSTFDYRVISDEELTTDKKIHVNVNFKANAEGLYAFGLMADQGHFLTAERQARDVGQRVANDILEQVSEESTGTTVESQTFVVDDLRFTVLGNIQQDFGIQTQDYIDAESKVYQKVFVKDNVLVGAICVNVPEKVEHYTQRIGQKEQIADIASLVPQPVVQEAVIGQETQAESTEDANNVEL